MRNAGFHLIRANMTTLYRSYSEKRDDDVSFRATVREIVNNKQLITGIEIGKSGTQLRALVPVFQRGADNLIGIVDIHTGLGNVHRKLLSKNIRTYTISCLLIERRLMRKGIKRLPVVCW